jgi:FtsH-binding integral membrane protein
MEQQTQTNPMLGMDDAVAESQRFMVKVYGWMCFALVVTGFVAMFVASSPSLLELVFSSSYTLFGIIIVEFLLVGALVGWVAKMSATTATAVFILYSALNGVVLSCIFLIYTAESISLTFFITAGTFGAMSFYGYTTKSDLTKWGSLLMMGLFGLIISGIVNWFMQSSALSYVTSCFGVLIFVGLTAYDTQKIKNMNIIGNEGTDEDKKEAIMGALTLYLDFINLFLYLLRLFGRRK